MRAALGGGQLWLCISTCSLLACLATILLCIHHFQLLIGFLGLCCCAAGFQPVHTGRAHLPCQVHILRQMARLLTPKPQFCSGVTRGWLGTAPDLSCTPP